MMNWIATLIGKAINAYVDAFNAPKMDNSDDAYNW